MCSRIVLRGRHLDSVERVLRDLGVDGIVDDAPDVVITHGGDGALLGAEYEFPGVPKLPIRDVDSGLLCSEHSSIDETLGRFLRGELEMMELPKLEGATDGGRVCGINDVFIHNMDRVGALRYDVFIDGEPYGREIIGDGLGVATVHGSTAYYRSITHSIFKIGIGLAFSNSTEVTNHLVLPDDSVISVRIARGPGLLVADNSPDVVELSDGAEVVIRKAEGKAIVLGLDNFMCVKCRRLRHPNEW